MSYYIYKLTIIDTPYYYIGKTKLQQRLSQHKSGCYNNSEKCNFKLYNKMRELVKQEDFYLKVKEERILERLTFNEATIGESKLINLNDINCLNSRNENVNRWGKNRKQYEKDYREKNKEKNKIYQKQKYIEKREERLLKAKQYREKNKTSINKKGPCNICGKVITLRGMKRHQQSKRCKQHNTQIINNKVVSIQDKNLSQRIKKQIVYC